MTRAALLSAALAASLALAACNSYPSGAPPQAAQGPRMSLTRDQCFRAADIRNHTIGDDRTMYLDVNGRGVYRLTMSSSCLAAAFANDPIITRQPPGSALVCRPMDVDLSLARGGAGATRCLVQSIDKLTPQEVAALPPKLRP